MKRAGLVACLLSLVATPAAAETPEDSGNHVKFKTVLVPFSLSGSTEGKGTAKFGAGLAWGVGVRTDMATSINASVATNDGIANIFSAKSGDSSIQQATPWELGGSFAVAGLSPPTAGDAAAGLPNVVRQRMFDACSARCSANPDDAFCKGRGAQLAKRARIWVRDNFEKLPVVQFCTTQRQAVTKADDSVKVADGAPPPTQQQVSAWKAARTAALNQCAADCISDAQDPAFCSSGVMPRARIELFQQYDRNNVCAEGERIYDDYQDAVGRSLFPAWQVTFGVAGGRDKFNYRATSDSTALLKHSDTKGHWKAGASLFGLLSQPHPVDATLEVMGLFASSWDASTKAIKWCTPVGDVPRTEPKPGDAVGATDPAESCQDGLLGGPAHTYSVTAAVRFGLLDGVHGSWRVAFGPQVRLPHDDKKWGGADVLVQLPIYGAATLFPGVDYKGVVRLTPSAGWTHSTDGERQFSVGVELALLGQRRILSDKFDEL